MKKDTRPEQMYCILHIATSEPFWVCILVYLDYVKVPLLKTNGNHKENTNRKINPNFLPKV